MGCFSGARPCNPEPTNVSYWRSDRALPPINQHRTCFLWGLSLKPLAVIVPLHTSKTLADWIDWKGTECTA